MIINFKELWGFPTWILTRVIMFFAPKSHPWKYRNFTLLEWNDGSTDLTDRFNALGWGLLCWIPIFIIF